MPPATKALLGGRSHRGEDERHDGESSQLRGLRQVYQQLVGGARGILEQPGRQHGQRAAHRCLGHRQQAQAQARVSCTPRAQAYHCGNTSQLHLSTLASASCCPRPKELRQIKPCQRIVQKFYGPSTIVKTSEALLADDYIVLCMVTWYIYRIKTGTRNFLRMNYVYSHIIGFWVVLIKEQVQSFSVTPLPP